MASVDWGVVVCPGRLIVTRAAARVRKADRMDCSATSQEEHGQLSSHQQTDQVSIWSQVPLPVPAVWPEPRHRTLMWWRKGI